MKLVGKESIYSGGKNNVYRLGIGPVVNKKASRCSLGWADVSNRILAAHVIIRKFESLVTGAYSCRNK